MDLGIELVCACAAFDPDTGRSTLRAGCSASEEAALEGLQPSVSYLLFKLPKLHCYFTRLSDARCRGICCCRALLVLLTFICLVQLPVATDGYVGKHTPTKGVPMSSSRTATGLFDCRYCKDKARSRQNVLCASFHTASP